MVGFQLFVEELEGREVPARILYVAPWGHDGSAGSYAQPFSTVAAAEKIVNPGDEIRFRGGTYWLTEPLSLYKSGTNAARIKVVAESGETVVLNAAGLPPWSTEAVSITGSNIDFGGFQIINSPRVGIAVWGGSHDAIYANTVRDSKGAGIYVGYSQPGVVEDIAITGNTVTRSSLSNMPRTANEGWPAAVVAEYTSGAKIIGNTVFKNYGEGINVVLSDNAVVKQNTAYDNFSANYYLDHATYTTVDGNLSYTTYDPAYYRFNLPAVGVQVANEVTKTTNLTEHLRITDNIIVGGRFGFYYGNYGVGGGLRDTLIAGNTIYGSAAASIRIDGDLHAWTTITNNIVQQHGGYAMVDYNGRDGLGGLSFRTNLWYGGRPEVGAGAGDVYADPMFVNPGGTDADSYRLRAGSAAIDRGSILPAALAVPSDYFGVSRLLDPSDIGATEFVGFTAPTGANSLGLAVNGSAFARNGSYRLTDTTSSGQAGSVFTAGKVGVTKFSTTFDFQITNPLADGLTFTFQNTSPWAVGMNGGGLGYQGIGKSVAVKFDLYNTAGEGGNSIGVYTAGQAPTLGAIDPGPWGIDFHSGHIFQARLDYSGTTLALTLTDKQTGAVYRVWYPIDIPANVDGSTAYVGFTAATGGLKSITDVLSWSYSSSAG